MRKIQKSEATRIANSDQCEVLEYPFDEKDINGSVISVRGRYPESGYALNKVCKEIVYITRGSGVLGLSDGTQAGFKQGDSLLIDANEKFYWEGNFESYMACTPAFDPDQHIEVIE